MYHDNKANYYIWKLFVSILNRVRSTWHAFQKIVHEGGVRGLWKGWVPNVQRAALVNLGGTVQHDFL